VAEPIIFITKNLHFLTQSRQPRVTN